MITEELLVVRQEESRGADTAVPSQERPPVASVRPAPRPQPEGPGLLWRVLLVLVGFGIAVTGWMLIISVFFSFIGLPMFFFGLALMQSQEP